MTFGMILGKGLPSGIPMASCNCLPFQSLGIQAADSFAAVSNKFNHSGKMLSTSRSWRKTGMMGIVFGLFQVDSEHNLCRMVDFRDPKMPTVNGWFMLVDFRDTSVDIGLKSFTTEHLMNHEGRRDDKQISRRTKGQRVRHGQPAVWMGLIVGLPNLNLYVLCVLMVCWPALFKGVFLGPSQRMGEMSWKLLEFNGVWSNLGFQWLVNQKFLVGSPPAQVSDGMQVLLAMYSAQERLIPIN